MIEESYIPELQEFIAPGKNITVLVVDDSRMIRSAMRERMEIGNLVVAEAENGEEAIRHVEKELPDIVLMDFAMPVLNGLEALKQLRCKYDMQRLPVIMATTMNDSDEIVLALDAGANDYLTKPIDFDVLWARLTNQILQKQASEYLCMVNAGLEEQIRQRTAELDSRNKELKKVIRERLQAESKLQKQANYDALTGLPNRSLASDRLDQTIEKAIRHELNPCVAFVDLDNFKYINDTLGHAAGDELLREASRRLSNCARKSDTVARLGGDEFLLILDDEKTHSRPREFDIRHVGDRIIDSFAKPFILDGHEVTITPSIGFAIYPQDGDDGNRLMRHADAAMYRSKNDGKNTYCFYSPEMTVKAKLRMNVESQLRYAIERDEMHVVYQPIVDAATGEIIKAEALLRWHNNELGMITPDMFIPVAEDTGLIVPIGKWVIETSCKQIKQWRSSGWRDISVTVNVSARQFQSDSSLVETVRECLETYDLPADALQLELTEGVLMKETTATIEIMSALENLGIKLLIDDFGTGYASLSYLQRYNFESIKIDRSYISNVLRNDQDAKLVRAVIAMANSLGMSVVSEGVETDGQVHFLLDADCKFAQGFFFSRPVASRDFEKLLRNNNTPDSRSSRLSVASVSY